MESPRVRSAPGESGSDVVEILPDDVVNQIAAGEVVERPASVVKELVDNALDAGARVIAVECESGGKARIRVTDDGAGMSPTDARRSLLRHATSKLRVISDLDSLTTMGFRGEALASIASVSRTTLTTRRAADLAATRIVVENGAVVSVSEVGAAPGTTVEVVELFANVPARLKFQKADATEASNVTEAVTRLALAHPAVAFRLRHGGRAVLEVAPERDGKSRVLALLGAKIGQRLHRVTGAENGFSVEAYLAAPELAQTTARGVQLFVGRRAVRDRGLLHAVSMGYGELVPRGRYPVAIVLLDAPAGQVDYNVHPQKSEVRFADTSAATAAVRHVVRAGVAAAPWLAESAGAATLRMSVRTDAPIYAADEVAPAEVASALAHRYAAQLSRGASPQLRFDRPPPSRAAEGPARWEQAVRAVHGERAPIAAPVASPVASPVALGGPPASRAAIEEIARQAVREAVAAGEVGSSAAAQPDLLEGDPASSGASPPEATSFEEESGATTTAGREAAAHAGFFSSLRYLGQLQLTYLVCEAAGELVLIDQHAAHERVVYQRLLERRRRQEGVPTQRLLFPTTAEVTPAQAALVEEVAALWLGVGYELEPFGRSAVAIKAVPADLRGADPVVVLRELLDEWTEAGASRAVESRLENMLATIACHCAVRAGDRLAQGEVEALLASLDAVDFRAHCPHGRPALLRLSLDEIARRFGR